MARQTPGEAAETVRASKAPADRREPSANTEAQGKDQYNPALRVGPQVKTDDCDMRQRMIREAAYERYAQRGYVNGFDLDDWLQAESDVDRLLRRRARTS